MERDCNNCVYSTRDRDCRKWECKGTITVQDVKAEARADAIEEFLNELKNYTLWEEHETILEIVAEQLKEQENG